jgi:alpha-galactosidase
MTKVALIGAGSTVFARRLIADLLSWPALQDAELALMDIAPEPLELMERLAGKMIQERGTGARVLATTERERAIEGASFVVSTIAVGGFRGRDRPEVTIPERYGLHQSVADTMGVGGVFRYLRTMPSLLEIGSDLRRLAPAALWLNYVNPMNMVMRTVGRALPEVRAVGLCHSVQGTAERLAGFVGVPHQEVAYWVAGINHQAWFLDFRRGTYRGEDLYPLLRQKMDDPEVYAQDRVRFEVMRHFGYFVTESSRHMSEYVPWFRRTAEDRERFTPPTGRPEGAARYEAVWESIKRQIAGEAPLELTRSREYCSYIINAVETNTPFRFNGNVPNTGLITNLPPDCSVEVPILVDNAGLHPCHVGDLPAQLAAINRTNVNVQELAVQSFLERDRDAAFQACALDPLAAATVGLDDLKKMTAELFEANARWLEGYESRLPSSSPPAAEPVGAAGR